MRRYRIFEPPGTQGRTEGARFLRDGFRPIAVVLPSLWLLVHRLYLPAVAVFLLDVLVMVATPNDDLPAAALLSLLLGLGVALEGPSLMARRLAWRGWRDAGAVWARDAIDAELLYYASETTEMPQAEPFVDWSGGPRSPLRPGQSLFDLRSA
ncbi:DUF2628 domain-containing protein [uncultured Aureimonas sp.]|uniref:DUF2628 domain-containing protein n=1 Tax=uncultured Aureimonas sp. TaxID=1604662 RepID=UPI0025DB9B46|nr:DUF2628 domain-containing protein [uncultured Aureimonas sp.]